MKLPGYYSSGQFARMAGVSLKTVRFYDKQNILKPSYRNPSGARFYTEEDFVRLQQILLLKYLGFSLEEIKELSIDTTERQVLLKSLQFQKKLVRERMEHMQLVETAIENAITTLEQKQQPDWSHMLELIHLTGMEKSLKTQYLDAENISARIRLHREFSTNPQGWFPWIYEQCELQSGMNVLELGCGNGALWTENMEHLPKNVTIQLSDISSGMLQDAKQAVLAKQEELTKQKKPTGQAVLTKQEELAEQEESAKAATFAFLNFDCHELPCEKETFDLVIANHMLFYCKDIEKVCREVYRVLKPGGSFVCATYGVGHMEEITQLVQSFDSRIILAEENLYVRFGLENGGELLSQVFPQVECKRYEDEIHLREPEALLDYILSCHGNQNQILYDKYKEFKSFVTEKTRYGFTITKVAGLFLAKK